MSGSETRETVRQLRSYATFSRCEDSDLQALVQAGGRFALPAGWTLVQEGIPSDACYVITDGTAKVFSDRTEIAEIGPGDVVGEMTLLGGGQRRATVTSVTPIRGLRVENSALSPLLDKYPRLRATLQAVYEQHGGGKRDDAAQPQ